MTWEAKAKLKIDLNPSRPVCRLQEESQLVEGLCENAVESWYLNRSGLQSGPYARPGRPGQGR